MRKVGEQRYVISVIKEVTVPCSGTLEVSAGLAQMDTSPTFTIWTEDGQVSTNASNNQDMGADTIYNNPIKIKATSKYAIGNPDHKSKGNILCIQSNATTIDSVAVDGADSAPTPKNLTAVAGDTVDCWYIPVITNDPNDGNDGEWNGELVTDTASTDPTTDDNMGIFLFDTDVDLDADTLEILYGIEDEDKNELGTGYAADSATIGNSATKVFYIT